MKKYVVTGGAGFIGSALVRALVAQGDGNVHVVDNLFSGRKQNLIEVWPKIEFHITDIRNYEEIFPVIRSADLVFHLAAIPSVPRSIHEPAPSHEVNIDGTFNVFRAAKDGEAGRVIYAASSSAYGDTEALPKIESMAPRPKSPYAPQKLMGEYYATVFSSCDGEQTRDFTYVDDVVALVLKAAAVRGVSGKVYNAGNGDRYSLNEVWRTLQKIEGVEIPATYAAARAGDVRDSQADTAAARRDLGHDPRYTLEQGLRRTLAWYRGEHKENLRGAVNAARHRL